MGGLLIRLGFVGYVLVLAFFALGRFSPSANSVLRSLGLRSAVGVFGYLLAGLIVSYVFLWRKTGELRRHREYLERQLQEQQDVTATDAPGFQASAGDPEGP